MKSVFAEKFVKFAIKKTSRQALNIWLGSSIFVNQQKFFFCFAKRHNETFSLLFDQAGAALVSDVTVRLKGFRFERPLCSRQIWVQF